MPTISLRALVGLSSPIMFNADVIEKGNPNPILEGPMGLCLFYDEIYFLHESLCPLNMRALPYVNFVNLEDLPEFDMGAIRIRFSDDKVIKFHDTLLKSDLLKIGKITQYGPEIPVLNRFSNPMEGVNRVYDKLIASHLGCDLVINSFSPALKNLEDTDKVHNFGGTLSSLLAQTIPYNLPNLQLPEGPCLDGVDNLRKHLNRGSFQYKLKDFDECELVDPEDEIVNKLLREMDDWSLGLMEKATDKNIPYKTGVNVVFGLLPGIGNIATCFQAGLKLSEYEKDQDFRWAAFLAEWKKLVDYH